MSQKITKPQVLKKPHPFKLLLAELLPIGVGGVHHLPSLGRLHLRRRRRPRLSGDRSRTRKRKRKKRKKKKNRFRFACLGLDFAPALSLRAPLFVASLFRQFVLDRIRCDSGTVIGFLAISNRVESGSNEKGQNVRSPCTSPILQLGPFVTTAILGHVWFQLRSWSRNRNWNKNKLESKSKSKSE